jgi:uroporphyrinogen-III synthase
MTGGPLDAPLSGKRILVTRPRAQAGSLCDRLAGLGAQPILFPTIQITPLDDYGEVDRAVAALADYDWIIFTSVNGVAAFWGRLERSGVRDLPGRLKAAAIGPATARALAQRGRRADYVPQEYVAEAIANGLADVAGKRILLPRADLARDALAAQLSRRGADVHVIAVYRTLPATPDARGLAELRRGVDAITFTSSSTVRNFAALVAWDDLPSPKPAIACIGPITAQAAREAGWPVDVVTREYTTDGLVDALADYYVPKS